MRRLDRLPLVRLPGIGDVREARGVRARLRGLAGLREPPAVPLLIPRTRSVHTCGMRFALDLLWLDAEERIVRIDRAVPPRRVRWCRGARAVVELAAQAPSDR